MSACALGGSRTVSVQSPSRPLTFQLDALIGPEVFQHSGPGAPGGVSSLGHHEHDGAAREKGTLEARLQGGLLLGSGGWRAVSSAQGPDRGFGTGQPVLHAELTGSFHVLTDILSTPPTHPAAVGARGLSEPVLRWPAARACLSQTGQSGCAEHTSARAGEQGLRIAFIG